MPLVKSSRFSASDLDLFVDSLEVISRLEVLREQRKQICCAQHHLDQSANTANYPTLLKSNNNPHEAASTTENFQEYHVAVNTSIVLDNDYDIVDDAVDNINETNDSLLSENRTYNLPYDYLPAANLDDDRDTLNLVDHQYEQLSQGMKKPKSKRKLPLVDFVCKKYKKCFSNNNANTEDWVKSDSWTKINLI